MRVLLRSRDEFPIPDTLVYIIYGEDKVKNTPSGLKTLNRKSRACNSEQRLASISARSRTSSFDRVFRDKSLFSPRVSKYFSKTSTSHVDAYLEHGGLLLETPFISQVTSGCCPKGTPSTGSCVIDTAEHIRLIVLCCSPSSKQSARKSKNDCIPQ